MKIRIFLAAAFLLVGITQALAQTSAFTYQGKLMDNGSPANGNYDLQFALFDSAGGGAQIGQIQTINNVTANGGAFTVTLDFGANAFPGAARFLEISTRFTGAAAFTLLTPRQQITSTPYAVRSLNTATADAATNAQQLGGVAADQYVKTDDARLSDQRDPKGGNSNYVQNTTSQQASANFNISGNGTAGGTLSGNTVVAATQYNLGSQKVLGLSSPTLLKVGDNANVGIGPTLVSGYKLEVETSDKNGMRLGSVTSGGNVLSIGGRGDVEIDAEGIPAGRLMVAENGNVGIGRPNPTSRLEVAGTVESTTGGFKFPDGSVQTNAVGKLFTTGQETTEIEIGHSEQSTPISTLTLPPGVYLVTATVQFENRANGFLQDNTRRVRCRLMHEFVWINRVGAPGSAMDFTTMTMHTVITVTGTPQLSLSCGTSENVAQVFAKTRRMTAIRVGDNPQ